ncbi:hypothetical protein SPYAA472_0994 [Streptococcus pyogenes AA472]|nr:hypothetical protein SPYAA472_0994 [Streptococcus pyogenes AA472]
MLLNLSGKRTEGKIQTPLRTVLVFFAFAVLSLLQKLSQRKR